MTTLGHNDTAVVHSLLTGIALDPAGTYLSTASRDKLAAALRYTSTEGPDGPPRATARPATMAELRDQFVAAARHPSHLVGIQVLPPDPRPRTLDWLKRKIGR